MRQKGVMELAKKTGMDPATVSRTLSKKRKPSIDCLLKMSKALKKSPGALLKEWGWDNE